MIKRSFVVFTFLLLLPFIAFSSSIQNSTDKDAFIKLEPKLIFTLGDSDDPNETFYKPEDIAVGKNGNVYVLDSGNSRIQCFSQKGEFLFSFGRLGQGPGELSDWASTLEILDDGYLYLIDNPQYRISIFTPEGKHVKSYKIKKWFDDIQLVGKTYYLSSFKFDKDYKTIYITKNLGIINKSFGNILDPGKNLFEQEKRLPVPLAGTFGNTKMSSLAVDSEGYLFYSQSNPYKIIKYDQKGDKILEFNRPVDFNTHVPMTVKYKDGVTTKSLEGPSTVIAKIKIINNRLFVPIFSPDRSENYIDIYDLNGNLIYACRLPIELYGSEKGTVVPSTEIDQDLNFYCLFYTREDPPLVKKYSIAFPLD